MKNSLKVLVMLAILAIAGLAEAQNSANANGQANATVWCPISIKNNTNLEFGAITNSATGGSVTVAPNGTTTYTGVVATTGSHAAGTHAANFTVGGQSQFTYSITETIATVFGGTGATLSNLTWAVGPTAGQSGGNGTGTGASSFPCDKDTDNDMYSADLVEDGNCGCVTDNLNVGGTCTLTSAANGSYAATINVAIAYN